MSSQEVSTDTLSAHSLVSRPRQRIVRPWHEDITEIYKIYKTDKKIIKGTPTVRPATNCPPRHPTHCQPYFFDLAGIL
jgi:hypothetical protein